METMIVTASRYGLVSRNVVFYETDKKDFHGDKQKINLI